MKIKKILALALAAVLLVAVSVAGTVAYLTAETNEVKNTFTAAGIELDLTETEPNWTMQLVPGTEKTKDPVVTVKTSVKAYVFVKFDCDPEVAENGTMINYNFTLNDGTADTYGYTWTQLPNTDVWYTIVDAKDTPYEWHLLTGDKVTVSANASGTDVATPFSIVFDAWAVQYAKTTIDGEVTPFEPAEAYNLVSGN